MRIGLVGFPGSGKSTVFGALTGRAVETGFTASGKAQLGSVRVPDPRVDALTKLYQPKKSTYAEVTFSDVPSGGNAGRNLDRDMLDKMREADALCQVVRAFHSETVPDEPDPLREVLDLEAETVLADLVIVERRIARLVKDRSNPRELALLENVRAHLETGEALRMANFAASERPALSAYPFLSDKPLLLAINVDEGDVAAPVPEGIAVAASLRGLGIVVLSAKVEMDIAQLPAEEQHEYCASLGLSKPARDRFIRAAFDLLDLISMLTVGEDECRAWPIRSGTRAPQAAGKIHSDIERGFIRAAVIPWQDLIDLGSEARCREAGKQHVEGKQYVIADGDVVNFRFNV